MKRDKKYTVRQAIVDLSSLDLDLEIDICSYWIQGKKTVAGSYVSNGKLVFYSEDRRVGRK